MEHQSNESTPLSRQVLPADVSEVPSVIEKIPQLIDQDHVSNMINVQKSIIERLEITNKSIESSITIAQNKLVPTTKLFKKTAKQIAESRKDLDYIFKKISDLKSKIRAEQSDLLSRDGDPNSKIEDEVDVAESKPETKLSTGERQDDNNQR